MAHSRRIGLQLHHPSSTARQTVWPSAGADDHSSEENATPTTGKNDDGPPILFHRFRHDKSILALAVTSTFIYAGTQGGEILVFAINTCERVRVIKGHNGSVLALCLSQDERMLFSSAGDRIVNIWDTSTFEHLASIYSMYDIGDVFCLSYSSRLETVYLGAQNTSIQWCNLKGYDSRPPPDPKSHPSQREDRFFDSSGPGGICTPKPVDRRLDARRGRSVEIDAEHITQFAHNGYVYCMLLAKDTYLEGQAEILISGGGDGTIKLWMLEGSDSNRIHEIVKLDDGRDEGDPVLTIALDGNFLYSGRADGEINVWDLETKQLVRITKAHDGDILTMALGRALLFSAAVTGDVKQFSQRYECVNAWQAHRGMVLASALTTHNDRFLYITGGNDHTVAVWDVSDCYSVPFTGTPTTQEQLVDSLRQFVAYRTVSSDPRYKADCRKGASYLRSVLKKFGAQTEMLKTEDGYNPIVLARFRGHGPRSAERKRILFYGHYDVIAAENKQNKWITNPFSMAGIDGYLYGRGTSDNKGPIMAAIYAVAELVAQRALDSDVVFLLEGEEECGSRGFEEAIKQYKHLIGPIDWILLANSYWLDDEVPCLTYGLRGVIHASIDICSDEPDLHSGVDGSSLLDEPLKDMVMLIGKITGARGKILIPEFYNQVLEITLAEKLLYDEISKALLERNPSLGSPEALTASFMQRWRRPTLTIHGFKTSGSEKATIIPHKAHAAISLRIVPDQDAMDIAISLVDFLQTEFEKMGSRNHLDVIIDHQAEPWLGDYTNEIFQTLEKAVMDVWGPHDGRRQSPVNLTQSASDQSHRRSSTNTRCAATTSSTLASSSASASPIHKYFPTDTAASTNRSASKPQDDLRKPLYIREGGSIPAIRFLEKEFNAPAAHLPCGQASDNAHLENERFRVLNLYNSKRIFKRVFLELPKR